MYTGLHGNKKLTSSISQGMISPYRPIMDNRTITASLTFDQVYASKIDSIPIISPKKRCPRLIYKNEVPFAIRTILAKENNVVHGPQKMRTITSTWPIWDSLKRKSWKTPKLWTKVEVVACLPNIIVLHHPYSRYQRQTLKSPARSTAIMLGAQHDTSLLEAYYAE
jgi:hypothetical protein